MADAGSGKPPPLSAAEETRLVAEAKNGDPRSFEALVDRYMGPAVRVAMGYVANRDDANDLAQEAFYRVFKALGRFRDGEPFAPWFFRIVRNACLTHLDKYRRRGHFSRQARHADGEPDVDLPDRRARPPEDVAELNESQRQFWSALERLPVNHREIIVLRHIEELDYAAIAAVLEIPIGTVMSRLFHARRRLRGLLEPYLGGHL